MSQAKPLSGAWHWHLRATEELPKGEVRVSLRSTKPTKGVRGAIHAVYITVPERGDIVARTRRFDGDSVVVEYGPNGEFLGIELLSLKEKSALPEFVEATKSLAPTDLLRVAFWTAHNIWHRVEFAIKLMFEESGKAPQPRSVLKADTAAVAWQTTTEDHLALAK